MGSPRFRILGPLEIEGGGPLGGPKQRALLIRLLLEANRGVPRERLIDELWGDAPPDSADHAVQVYISQLRKALPPSSRIRTQGPVYRLEVDESEIDALRFERLVAEGRRRAKDGDPRGAAAVLREADELWRGDLPGNPLEELRIAAAEDRIDAELAAGRAAEVVPEIEQLIRDNALRERFRGQLMLALYRSGRQADALEAYRDARSVFVDALGVEPGPELRDLEAAILRQDESLQLSAAPLRRIPAPPTTLVGRTGEIGEVADLLRQGARVVTLTGPGGAGKTRLAVEVARTLTDAFADGVVVVELATLRDPSLVVDEIARAAGEEDTQSLADRLHDRELLFVLDNFEQVDEAAPNVARLLDAPRLSLLVTSRQPMRIYGEHEYPVPPLAEDEAVELFVSRARAVRRDPLEPEDVAELCRRLDRLPLAIELVAARVRDHSLTELLELLTRRLELAVAGPRDLPARQQTLRATINWSYALLDERERLSFERLGVLAGAFSSETAEAICEAAPEVLSSLAERNLIVRIDRRYRLLETIREYALEQLDATDRTDTRRRHAEHFLGLAQRSKELRNTDGELAWFDVLETERDNLREALAWLIAHDVEGAAALALGAYRFWYIRGYFNEGRHAYEQVRAHAGHLPLETQAELLMFNAAYAFEQRDLTDALRLAEESLVLQREREDAAAIARSLVLVGTIHGEAGDAERAVPLLEEAVELAHAAGDARVQAFTTSHLALAALNAGDLKRAHAVARESVALNHGLGDLDGERAARTNLATAALALNDLEEALRQFSESLVLARQLGNPIALLETLEGIAAVAARQGEEAAAARLLGSAEAFAEAREVSAEAISRSLREETLAGLRDSIGAEAVEVRLAEGRATSIEEAAATASAIANTLSAPSGRPAGRSV